MKLQLKEYRTIMSEEAEHIDYNYFTDPYNIFVDGELSQSNIHLIIDKFLFADRLNQKTQSNKPINLYIDSNGGRIRETLNLCHMMRLSNSPIRTIAMGQVCSAAFYIFCAGDERQAFEGSVFLSHPMSCTWSTEHGGTTFENQRLILADLKKTCAKILRNVFPDVRQHTDEWIYETFENCERQWTVDEMKAFGIITSDIESL